MRLRRNRLAEYQHCAMEQKKDNEGGTYTEYGPPSSFLAEMWAAGGKFQADMYGTRLPNIRNLRLAGTYEEIFDKGGKLLYAVKDGPTIGVNDGICLYGGTPDYRVTAIYPYRFLTLEVEKL